MTEEELDNFNIRKSVLIKKCIRLEEENAELKKNCEDLKEFYEKEYFEIADKTANERIKELEQYETEITVDDYSPYDENTWGMMHEEIFVPKNLVIDMLKEIYAYIENLKKENAELKEKLKPENCLKLLAKDGYIKFTSDNLTKAKELIKKFLLWENDWHDKTESKYELLKEAEQFLNSEVEK